MSLPLEAEPAGTVEVAYNPAAAEAARFEAFVGPVRASGETPVHALARLGEKLKARRERHDEQARRR